MLVFAMASVCSFRAVVPLLGTCVYIITYWGGLEGPQAPPDLPNGGGAGAASPPPHPHQISNVERSSGRRVDPKVAAHMQQRKRVEHPVVVAPLAGGNRRIPQRVDKLAG